MSNWDKYKDILLKCAQEYNVLLTPEQLEQFKEYWIFLDEYNKHTNLVSNTDLEVVIVKHFIDSISIGLCKDYINWESSNNIIDIGIGGGFPGIPIIIANPKWKLCALDSVGKKTKFIELLTQKLEITDRVEVINARAEDFLSQVYDKCESRVSGLEEDKGSLNFKKSKNQIKSGLENKEKFDIAVSRAVSQLSTLSEYCLPFVKIGGYFIAYKAKEIDEELKQSQAAISILGGLIENIISYKLPDGGERKLVLIKKIRPTSPKYPRKSGIPKKQPLGIQK